MPRHFCTYFDSGYLARGLVLIHSIQEHVPSHEAIHVLALDEEAAAALDSMSLPKVVVHRLSTLEERIPELLTARGNRTRTEYIWTLTPVYCASLMAGLPGGSVLYYVDADMRFYADVAVLEAEFENASVAIHEHRFPFLLKDLDRNGRFNVGLIGFRRDEISARVLERWCEQCLESCRYDPASGSCGDQKYLDEWPELHGSAVKVLQHPGAGVAPWNVSQVRVAGTRARPTIDGNPLIFFHFHGLRAMAPGRWIHAFRFHIPAGAREIIYVPYVEELCAAGAAGTRYPANRLSLELQHWPFRFRTLSTLILAARWIWKRIASGGSR